MAHTLRLNPQYFSGPIPTLKKVTPIASRTWQAGAFMKSTDSGWVPCISADIVVHGIAAASQPTASAVATKVWVHRINTSATKLLIGCTTGGNDDIINPAYVGGNYGIAVNSCVYSVSFGCDTSASEVLHVEGRLCDIQNGLRGVDSSDSPGFAIVSVKQAMLDGEATGV